MGIVVRIVVCIAVKFESGRRRVLDVLLDVSWLGCRDL